MSWQTAHRNGDLLLGRRQYCAQQPPVVPFSDSRVPLDGEKRVKFSWPVCESRGGVGGLRRGKRAREDGRILRREESWSETRVLTDF